MTRDRETTWARQKDGRQVFLWVGLIVLITFIAYGPTLRNGFVWDDFTDVVENQLLRTNQGLRDLWTAHWRDVPLQYYPLTYTTFWMDYHVWELQPLGYHVVNVLLHTANAILIGFLLTRLSVPGAWLAALIFAVHPVQVESVAWIAERKNVLSGFFFLLAFLAYLRFFLCPVRRWWFYGVAIALYLCALLGKTAVVPLPAVLLVVLWWKREKINREDLVSLVPLFLLGAAMGLATAHFEAAASNTQFSEWHLSLIQRFLLAGRDLWFYAGKVIWPHPVMIIYPLWEIDPSAWWQYLYPVAALAAILALWCYRARLGKAPLAAVLYFALMLAPVLGFFTTGYFSHSFVADHFQYLASIGLIALVAACATQLVREESLRIFAGAIVVTVLCFWSWHHCDAFRDQKTLFGEEAALNPRSWEAPYNLGNACLRAGRLQDAIEQYERAIQIKPDQEMALNNLAFALLQMGMANEAVDRLEQVVRINAKSADAHYNLATALVRVGRIQDAVRHYEEAVRLKPDFAEAHLRLGVVLNRKGQVPEAISEYLQALRFRPDYPEALNDLGLALANQRKFDEAIVRLEEALRLDPDYAEARYNLAAFLAKQGRIDEAISQVQSGLKIEPNSERFQRALDRLQRAKTATKSD